MRAIIDATGCRAGISPLLYYKPTPLLCIAGKPIIIHVIEFLIQQRVTHIDMVLNHLPQKVEKELGTGERWGISITYHLARDAAHPFQVVRTLAHLWDKGGALFALGDCLPEIDPATFKEPLDDIPLLYMYPNRRWTGWGILPLGLLENVPKNLVEEDFPGLLNGRYKSVEAKPFLSVHNFHELQESNIRFLNAEHAFSVFPTTARCVEPGIWISRGVSLHSTAKITPPVFIGEYCQINKDTVIGPNAVIEDFCIIDDGSDVVDSIVCKRSYIGENLNVQDSIVDRNLLVNLPLDTHVTVCDDFILGESYPRSPLSAVFNLFERALAAMLFVLLYPINLLMQCNHHLRSETMLRLPAHGDPVLWETFEWETFELNAGRQSNAFHRCFFRLPLLKAIVRGDIHFIGVIPRHPKDVEKMSPDWKKLYLSSKVGIITVSDLEAGGDPSPDQCYASESLYATQKGLFYDVKMFGRWALRKIQRAFLRG